MQDGELLPEDELPPPMVLLVFDGGTVGQCAYCLYETSGWGDSVAAYGMVLQHLNIEHHIRAWRREGKWEYGKTRTRKGRPMEAPIPIPGVSR